jgi:predicted nucleic acid-binding protein
MYLLDTDFLFAYFFNEQSTHQKAKIIMDKIENSDLYITNIVLQELATVLSNKQSQAHAKIAIENCKLLDLRIIKMTDEEELAVWVEFNKIDKNKTSFIDCSNLYLAINNNYKIASFDNFYPSEILVNA